MNNLLIFNSEEFGDIRTVTIDNEPWFVGKDVAEALGYAEPRSAVSKKVDDADRGVAEMETPSGKQNMTVINESGLYALIFGSKLESAKRFKHWVTSEVLPAIRRTGNYQMAKPQGEELLALAVIEAKKTIDSLKNRCTFLGKQIVEQQQIITELQPKANYVDMVLQSKSLVLTTQIAKDYGISAKKLNQILKDLKIQYKVGGQWVLYSKYQNNGYVHSRTIDITRSDGRADVVMQTEWTQKGRLFLYENLKKHDYIPVIEQAS